MATGVKKNRPNFRIVDGEYPSDIIYEDIKKDYLDPSVKVSDILEKYNISQKKYSNIRKDIVEETGVMKKPSKYDYTGAWIRETRFIDQIKTTGKFRVSKVINGNYFHFGVYDDLRTALEVRDFMEECDWDMEKYKKLRVEKFGDEIVKEVNIHQIYDEFKKDFMDGYRMDWLIEKYGITQTQYTHLSKMIRKEMGILRKPRRRLP